MFRRLSRTMSSSTSGREKEKEKEEKKFKYKAFLSHNWGKDKTNHERVQQVYNSLKEKGIHTWLDQEQLEDHLAGEISKGIEESEHVIIFLTEEYMNKVNQRENPNDFCKLEFNYAVKKKPHNLIVVAMEARMKDTSNWEGELGFRLADRKYIDLSQESLSETAANQIVNRLLSSAGNTNGSQGKDKEQSGVLSTTASQTTSNESTSSPGANPIKTPRQALGILQHCSSQTRSKVKEAIDLLGNKTSGGDWARQTVTELPQIESIVSQTLLHFESDEEMSSKLLWLTGGLCKDENMRVKFMKVGILQHILTAMSSFIANSEIASSACYALGCLSFQNSDHQVTLMRKGADDAILSAMKRHAGVARVAQQACGALGNMALNTSDNKVTLMRKGADDAILSAMERHAGVAGVAQDACNALGALSLNNNDNQVTLMQKGADDAILSAMKRHAGVASVAEGACAALCCLSFQNSDHQVTLMRKCVDDAILSAMVRHAGVASVAGGACAALVNLTRIKKFRKRLRDKGVLKLAKEIKSKFPGSEAAKQATRLQQCLS